MSVGLGYSTFAFFSDSETAAENIFTAGTLDLHVGSAESQSGFFDVVDFAPGDIRSGSLRLSNAGTVYDNNTAGHRVDLNIGFDTSSTDGIVHDESGGDSTAAPLHTWLNILELKYDGVALAATDVNLNGRIDLGDIDGKTWANLADPGPGGKDLTFKVQFDYAGGNDLQGDTTSFAFDFYLFQKPFDNDRGHSSSP